MAATTKPNREQSRKWPVLTNSVAYGELRCLHSEKIPAKGNKSSRTHSGEGEEASGACNATLGKAKEWLEPFIVFCCLVLAFVNVEVSCLPLLQWFLSSSMLTHFCLLPLHLCWNVVGITCWWNVINEANEELFILRTLIDSTCLRVRKNSFQLYDCGMRSWAVLFGNIVFRTLFFRWLLSSWNFEIECWVVMNISKHFPVLRSEISFELYESQHKRTQDVR